MSSEIKLHKNDLPDDLDLGNLIAVDGEFMGLNVKRDPLCLIQLSSGNNDAHIIQLDRKNYNAPNLKKILADNNVDISKQFQSSDFGGELSPAQLKYCANDVIYLHNIHQKLMEILKRENREELYIECLKFLNTRVDLDLAFFKDDIWAH